MALSGLAALASAEGQRQLSIFWTTGPVGTLTEWSQWKVRALAKAWATTRPESGYGRNTWITGLVEAVMKDKRRKAQHTVDDWAGWHAHSVVAIEGLGLGQGLGSYTPGIGLRPKHLDQGIGGGRDEGQAPESTPNRGGHWQTHRQDRGRPQLVPWQSPWKPRGRAPADP